MAKKSHNDKLPLVLPFDPGGNIPKDNLLLPLTDASGSTTYLTAIIVNEGSVFVSFSGLRSLDLHLNSNHVTTTTSAEQNPSGLKYDFGVEILIVQDGEYDTQLQGGWVFDPGGQMLDVVNYLKPLEGWGFDPGGGGAPTCLYYSASLCGWVFETGGDKYQQAVESESSINSWMMILTELSSR